MRVTNADSYSYSYSCGIGNSNGNCNGHGNSCGIGNGNCDGHSHSCGIGDSDGNGNGNGNCDAHAAAYSDAETCSHTADSPDHYANALAAADATLIEIIQAGTREQTSRVPMTSLATDEASSRPSSTRAHSPGVIEQTGHVHGDVRKIVLTHFCGFRYKSILLSECREINSAGRNQVAML